MSNQYENRDSLPFMINSKHLLFLRTTNKNSNGVKVLKNTKKELKI